MPRTSRPLAAGGLLVAFGVPLLEFGWGALINAHVLAMPSTEVVMAITPWAYLAALLVPVGFMVVAAAMRGASLAARILVVLTGVPVALGAWVAALFFFSFAVGEPF